MSAYVPSLSKPSLTSQTLSPEEKAEQYRELARAVVELAWRDARPTSFAASEAQAEAQEFLFSEAAEFWAFLAGVNLARMRRLLRTQLRDVHDTGTLPDTP